MKPYSPKTLAERWSCSSKHMQRYLDEFTFRATNRGRVNGMFDLLVGAL